MLALLTYSYHDLPTMTLLLLSHRTLPNDHRYLLVTPPMTSASSGHRDLLVASADPSETPEGGASSDPFPAYRAAVSEATDGFSSVSQRVLALLARLRTQPAAAECTEALERIQDLERQKLQMVSERY